MRTLVFSLSAVLVLALAGESRADKKGPPTTRKVVTKDGKFVFVMLAPQPPEEELKHYGNEASKEAVRATRAAYKKSGLYKNDGSAEPLWTVDWYAEAAVPLPAGVHLVRYGQPTLEQWRNKDPRKPREVTENDLKQEALSVFADGKLLRTFTIADFADDRTKLRASVTMVLWAKERRLDEENKRLVVVTHDGNRVVIDLPTAKIVEKKKAE